MRHAFSTSFIAFLTLAFAVGSQSVRAQTPQTNRVAPKPRPHADPASTPQPRR